MKKTNCTGFVAYLPTHRQCRNYATTFLNGVPRCYRHTAIDHVQVLWDDACHAREHRNAKPLRTMSFGLLIGNNNGGVVIAQTQNEQGDFLDCLYIPKGCLVKIIKVPLP